MDGGEVDQAAVEVFHLDAEGVELGDEVGEAPLGFLPRPHRALEGARIQVAVSGHSGLQRREALRPGESVPPRVDEALDERPDHRQGLVRLLLCEQAHLRVE